MPGGDFEAARFFFLCRIFCPSLSRMSSSVGSPMVKDFRSHFVGFWEVDHAVFFSDKTIQLQGMHQGPSLCLEEATSFKLSRVDSRGVWLQLVPTVMTNDVADSY